MRVLLVAATAAEVAPIIARLAPGGAHRGHHVDVLVTGVGMVPTAANVSKALGKEPYAFALNVGVCGSFDAALPPGTSVNIVSECFADVGAEDGERFLSVLELGLMTADEFPFSNGCLVPIPPPPNAALDRLPRVRGISVNTAHGHQPSIDAVVRRLNPQVESMEGGGFVYACSIHETPSAEVRVVSNAVEHRSRAAWKLTEAIETLGATTLAILDSLGFTEAASEK